LAADAAITYVILIAKKENLTMLPFAERAYWPTSGWLTAPPAEHGIDERQLTQTDLHIQDHLPNVTSLLVIRYGYLVFERYIESIEGYGYLWWIACEHDIAICYAAGYGGQYIGVVPELDLVVVITGDTRDISQDHRPIISDFVLSAVKRVFSSYSR
jgi:hypothetical protein